ncbi:uncharacterized protein PSFLO_04907 [Pseudozyma flocculosa]|uniref:Uncharacterized protein n=1 Tax=Pseudozyma flocculosa TaxID=84751 RepID=A0A5C3F611_9BASI|nr:uncharacterized protein PSFLO_04907 [Pseudozyma flocculosa]
MESKLPTLHPLPLFSSSHHAQGSNILAPSIEWKDFHPPPRREGASGTKRRRLSSSSSSSSASSSSSSSAESTSGPRQSNPPSSQPPPAPAAKRLTTKEARTIARVLPPFSLPSRHSLSRPSPADVENADKVVALLPALLPGRRGESEEDAEFLRRVILHARRGAEGRVVWPRWAFVAPQPRSGDTATGEGKKEEGEDWQMRSDRGMQMPPTTTGRRRSRRGEEDIKFPMPSFWVRKKKVSDGEEAVEVGEAGKQEAKQDEAQEDGELPAQHLDEGPDQQSVTLGQHVDDALTKEEEEEEPSDGRSQTVARPTVDTATRAVTTTTTIAAAASLSSVTPSTTTAVISSSTPPPPRPAEAGGGAGSTKVRSRLSRWFTSGRGIVESLLVSRSPSSPASSSRQQPKRRRVVDPQPPQRPRHEQASSALHHAHLEAGTSRGGALVRSNMRPRPARQSATLARSLVSLAYAQPFDSDKRIGRRSTRREGTAAKR